MHKLFVFATNAMHSPSNVLYCTPTKCHRREGPGVVSHTLTDPETHTAGQTQPPQTSLSPVSLSSLVHRGLDCSVRISLVQVWTQYLCICCSNKLHLVLDCKGKCGVKQRLALHHPILPQFSCDEIEPTVEVRLREYCTTIAKAALFAVTLKISRHQ